jgi:hypothetical protein
MKNNLDKSELEKVLREEGGIGYTLRIYEAFLEVGQIWGSNELRENVIKIYISPTFELDQKSINFLKRSNRRPDITSIVTDILRHEIAHWEYPKFSRKGCPYDLFLAEEIFDNVNRGLPPSLRSYSDYVANVFMDIIANLIVASTLMKRRENYAGQVWFYYDQGMANAARFSPFYDFFIRIQSYLWMRPEEIKFLRSFFNSEPSISTKIEKCVGRFFDELELKRGVRYSEYNLAILLEKERWGKYAEIFARISSELLDYGVKEILTGGESVGKKSRFERKLEDPEFLKEAVKKRQKEGKEMPTYLSSGKVLSHLYRGLAEEIPIIVENPTENYDFPVVGYRKRESDEISRKIGIDDEGNVQFLEPKHWWRMPIPVKRDVQGGVPNIYFIIDCSSSMRDPQRGRMIKSGEKSWTDESKFHYALLGFYGILNYLTRNNILPSQIGLTMFSTTSRSIVVPPTNIERLEQLLFDPEFNYTFIDLPQIRMIARKLEGKKVIVMLSDGEIFNWSDVKNGIKNIMGENYSAFISIGEKYPPYYDLADVAKVFYVENQRELSKIMLDFVRESYRELI